MRAENGLEKNESENKDGVVGHSKEFMPGDLAARSGQDIVKPTSLVAVKGLED